AWPGTFRKPTGSAPVVLRAPIAASTHHEAESDGDGNDEADRPSFRWDPDRIGAGMAARHRWADRSRPGPTGARRHEIGLPGPGVRLSPTGVVAPAPGERLTTSRYRRSANPAGPPVPRPAQCDHRQRTAGTATHR